MRYTHPHTYTGLPTMLHEHGFTYGHNCNGPEIFQLKTGTDTVAEAAGVMCLLMVVTQGQTSRQISTAATPLVTLPPETPITQLSNVATDRLNMVIVSTIHTN